MIGGTSNFLLGVLPHYYEVPFYKPALWEEFIDKPSMKQYFATK